MQFDQRHEGDYVIYAGAVEAKGDRGYRGAVVVIRVRGDEHTEVYRNESLAGGHCFSSPTEAISYATSSGRSAIGKSMSNQRSQSVPLGPKRQRSVERIIEHWGIPKEHPAMRLLEGTKAK